MSDLDDDLEMLSDGFGHITADSATRNALFQHGSFAFLVTGLLDDGLLALEIRAYENGVRKDHPSGTAMWAICLRAPTN